METTEDTGFTNGYPDHDALLRHLKQELADAEQQLAWCNKPGDDVDGWEAEVARLRKELANHGQ